MTKKTITDEGCIDMLSAMYKLAVRDDCAEVGKRVLLELMAHGVNKRKAIEYINSNADAIKKAVQYAVCDESRHYGSGTRKIRETHMERLVKYMVERYGRQT